MGLLNKILTAINGALPVQIYGPSLPSSPTLEGNPLGTADESSTGEIGLKVIVIADRSAPSGAGEEVQGTAADGSIAVGNPVQIGGVVVAANGAYDPNYSIGQIAKLAIDQSTGALIVQLGGSYSIGGALNEGAVGVSTRGVGTSTPLATSPFNLQQDFTTFIPNAIGAVQFQQIQDENTGGILSQPVRSNTASSTAYENSRVIKASPGIVYNLSGYNSKATAQFIQIFNSTTVPADTAIPIFTGTAAGLSNFNFNFGPLGLSFSTGVSISNSSTGATKTIGSADCFFSVSSL